MTDTKGPPCKRIRQGTRAKVWAALTLAVAVTTGGLIASAGAQENGQRAAPSKMKHCAGSAACLDGNNKGTGPGVQGSNTSTGPGVQGTSTANYGVIGRSSGLDAAVGAFNTCAGSGASGVYGQSLNGIRCLRREPERDRIRHRANGQRVRHGRDLHRRGLQ